MLERAETMAFAAGALVFPGGRIDPEDHAMAARFPETRRRRRPDRRDPGDDRGDRSRAGASARARRRRAARGDGGRAGPSRLCSTRWACRSTSTRSPPSPAGAPISARRGASTPSSIWPRRRRAGGPLHSADETESVHTFWASAGDGPRRDRGGPGQGDLPDPPQPRAARRLRLAGRGPGRRGAPSGAADHPLGRGAGRPRFVCIPEGIGYPVTAEPYESARRR